jgi:hypothetical protein
MPDSPQGEYDQATTGNDELNGRIGSEGVQRPAESDCPIDAREDHEHYSIAPQLTVKSGDQSRRVGNETSAPFVSRFCINHCVSPCGA